MATEESYEDKLAVEWINSEEGQTKLAEAQERVDRDIERLREARRVKPGQIDEPFTPLHWCGTWVRS